MLEPFLLNDVLFITLLPCSFRIVELTLCYQLMVCVCRTDKCYHCQFHLGLYNFLGFLKMFINEIVAIVMPLKQSKAKDDFYLNWFPMFLPF
jgi:hypothetical protein